MILDNPTNQHMVHTINPKKENIEHGVILRETVSFDWNQCAKENIYIHPTTTEEESLELAVKIDTLWRIQNSLYELLQNKIMPEYSVLVAICSQVEPEDYEGLDNVKIIHNKNDFVSFANHMFLDVLKEVQWRQEKNK